MSTATQIYTEQPEPTCWTAELDAMRDEQRRQTDLIGGLYEHFKSLKAVIQGTMKSHYTVKEVAEIVGKAPYTIRTHIEEGKLVASKTEGGGPKGQWLIARGDLEKYLRHEQANQPAPSPPQGGPLQ